MKFLCLVVIAIGLLIPSYGSAQLGQQKEYEWKESDTIWYRPTFIAKKTQETEYDLCEEQFGNNKEWKVDKTYRPWDSPCILQPDQTIPWVVEYLKQAKEYETFVQKNEGLPPDKRMSDKKLKIKRNEFQSKYQKYCPSTFKLNINNVMGSLGDIKAGEYVECQGEPTIKCKKGLTLSRGKCAGTTTSDCEFGAPLDQDPNICISCPRGGVIDKNPKRSTLNCSAGAGGICTAMYYCKTKITKESQTFSAEDPKKNEQEKSE